MWRKREENVKMLPFIKKNPARQFLVAGSWNRIPNVVQMWSWILCGTTGFA